MLNTLGLPKAKCVDDFVTTFANTPTLNTKKKQDRAFFKVKLYSEE